MIRTLEELVSMAQKHPPVRVAVAAAAHSLVLQSIRRATEIGIVEPLLVGREIDVRREAEAIGWDLNGAQLVLADTGAATAATAVELVKRGKAEVLMKGYLHTDEMLRAILNQQAGLRTDRLLTHVFVLEVPTYHKLLMISDAAININPQIAEKAAIAQNAIDLARRLGVEIPKVAALSSVETVNPSIPSTVHAACLSKMAQRGQIKGAIVDGPLAFDNAISAEAASDKGIDSPVSGDVDVVVVPDLDAGNILSKNLEYLAQAKMAGIVMGASAPVVLTSRSDPPKARVYSLALAGLLCRLGGCTDRLPIAAVG
ncbi:MAG TPA: bifunctional enoyl-CoA hydratase/phosphate acetyltransferase [Anaerolineae bacterium]|nr:bifunctional enoyl-CoA hydratase/phosphate acetyltransferase [Anaerolineae bacterium]